MDIDFNKFEPKCPANYFGKGEDYILTDNADEIKEFEENWKEWEVNNPNDPTGEIALQIWKDSKKKTRAFVTAPPPIATKEEKEILQKPIIVHTRKPLPTQVIEEFKNVDLQLKLPNYLVEQFKTFCRDQKRRPRDIMIYWIKLHARLNDEL